MNCERKAIPDSLSLRNLKWFLWIPDQVRDDKEMRKDKEVRKDKEMRNDMLTKISPFGRNDKRVRKDNSGFAKLAELLKVSLDSRFRGNDTGVRFTISDSLSLWNLSWFHWIPAFAGMTK